MIPLVSSLLMASSMPCKSIKRIFQYSNYYKKVSAIIEADVIDI